MASERQSAGGEKSTKAKWYIRFFLGVAIYSGMSLVSNSIVKHTVLSALKNVQSGMKRLERSSGFRHELFKDILSFLRLQEERIYKELDSASIWSIFPFYWHLSLNLSDEFFHTHTLKNVFPSMRGMHLSMAYDVGLLDLLKGKFPGEIAYKILGGVETNVKITGVWGTDGSYEDGNFGIDVSASGKPLMRMQALSENKETVGGEPGKSTKVQGIITPAGAEGLIEFFGLPFISRNLSSYVPMFHVLNHMKHSLPISFTLYENHASSQKFAQGKAELSLFSKGRPSGRIKGLWRVDGDDVQKGASFDRVAKAKLNVGFENWKGLAQLVFGLIEQNPSVGAMEAFNSRIRKLFSKMNIENVTLPTFHLEYEKNPFSITINKKNFWELMEIIVNIGSVSFPFPDASLVTEILNHPEMLS